MRFDIVTLFPELLTNFFDIGVIGRAKKNGLIDPICHQMREWAWNSYGAVDDRPYGGGVGMLIRPDVIANALREIKFSNKGKVILTSAKGKLFNEADAERLSCEKELIIVCGRYEGFDQRIVETMVDEEISIGEYVLSGGEIPAMVMIDAISRLLPGVLGKDESSKSESFSEIEIDNEKLRIAEYPQYTRPEVFENLRVPSELLSGDPKKIEEFRKKWILSHCK